VEYALLASLYLRLDVYFVRASYGKSSVTDIFPGVGREDSSRKDVSIGYGLAPAISLRLVF
jgi:hypothetical protein